VKPPKCHRCKQPAPGGYFDGDHPVCRFCIYEIARANLARRATETRPCTVCGRPTPERRDDAWRWVCWEHSSRDREGEVVHGKW